MEHLEDDFIVDLQHLAEAEGFQALIALDAKHCTHDDICGTTCALEHHLEEPPTDKQKQSKKIDAAFHTPPVAP